MIAFHRTISSHRRAAVAVVAVVAAFMATSSDANCRAATAADSVSRYGAALYVNPGTIPAMDEYVSRWLKKSGTVGVGIELLRATLPSDSVVVASDFGYPTFALGLRYTFNGAVRMHRDPDASWGKAQEVDYDSHLGNTVTLYMHFVRPLLRTKHWEADYTLGLGLGYNSLYYNKKDDIDNELIGTGLSVYFNAGAHVTWYPAKQWGVRVGAELVHHSNGALDRPNKGTNAIGPSVALVYAPYRSALVGAPRLRQPFEGYWYAEISVGVGAKTLMEEWNLTQFRTDPGDDDYRTEHFHLYTAYSLQCDVMRRYARRWASGIAIDVFYGTYYKRVREIDRADGYALRHSPWSLGIAVKHEVYYGRWSVPMELGYYLYRHMGHNASEIETPYYERIGVRYSIPSLAGISVGVQLCAHALKANFTELCVGIPVRL